MFSNSLVNQILEYIDKNLYKKITIEELSNIFHYNKDYLMRLFKREIQLSIVDYINHKRIYNSLESFKDNQYSILGIALKYGFFSQEYYCEIFKNIMGVSPRQYKYFLICSYILDEKYIIIIQDRISSLYSFIQRIDDYKRNIPPTDTVKVLSIFKNKTP